MSERYASSSGGQYLLGKQRVLTFLVVVLAVVLRWNSLSGIFLGNAGWLQLARANALGTTQEPLIIEALDLFQRATTSTDAPTPIAFLGAGMAYAILGNGAAALSSWQKARVTPQELIGFGDWARVSQRWNDALFYYRSAATVEQDGPDKGEILAAELCQRFLYQPYTLNQPNQAYCQDYFSKNDGNLVVNGQFDRGHLSGWRQRYFSSRTAVLFTVDKTEGKPAPAGSVQGLKEGYHGGLFQEIAVPPGAIIRFSAWIKIESEGEIEVRLLHFRITSKGRVLGKGTRRIVSQDMGWTRLETKFRAPGINEPVQILFFPVLVLGIGTVWLDDVRVELLSPE